MLRRRIVSAAPAALVGVFLAACGQSKSASSSGANTANASSPGRSATVELDKGGSFTIQLFPDDAPKTVQNFVDKANSGFYNGLTFHRVEDWVVQGGDPSGNGTGGGTMPAEISTKQKPFVVGSAGIARGQDIRINNAAQFFVCTKEASWLNGQYTNFGQVTQGMDVVKGVHVGDKIKRITLKS